MFRAVCHVSLNNPILLLLKMQVWEGKHTDEKKERANGELKTENLLEVASDLIKEPMPIPSAQTKEEVKLLENGSVAEKDLPKGAKPVIVAEKRIIANGVANGC
jgi:hypothetical protein